MQGGGVSRCQLKDRGCSTEGRQIYIEWNWRSWGVSLVAFCTNLVVIIRQQYFVVVVVVVRDALQENWEISAVADDFSFCVMKIAIS